MEVLSPALHNPCKTAGSRTRMSAVILVLALLLPASLNGQVDEYRLKAAFLFNFAKFVEWPRQTFKSPSDPIVICILGRNPFGSILGETIGGKSAGGRTFAVRQLSESQGVAGCTILFVSASAAQRFRDRSRENSGILTVGETPAFAACGGIIAFKLEHGTIQFQINTTAAERAQLQISSKLLSLAEVVKGGCRDASY